MPVVIKASDNGFVDAAKKLICLPSYLRPTNERRDSLMRSAAAVATAPTFYQVAGSPALLNEMTSSDFTHLNDTNTVPATSGDATWVYECDMTITTDRTSISKNLVVTVFEPTSTVVMLGGASLFSMHRCGDAQV
jgi:hypothetical protein